MNKREQKKLETKQTIIKVAKELFLDRGLLEVQMQEIADDAQIGIATLFRYFPKKEYVVFTVANEILEDMDTHIRKIIEQSLTAYEKISRILDYYTEMTGEAHTKLIRFHHSFDLYTSMAEYPDDMMTPYRQSRERFLATLMQIVKDSEVDRSIREDIDQHLLVTTIVHSFSFFCVKIATTNPQIVPVTSPDSLAQIELMKTMFLEFIKP